MTIPRAGLLLVVFLLSLLFWAVWYLPARVLVTRLPVIEVAGAPLVWTHPAGTVWHGQTGWQWRGYNGVLAWGLKFHGLMPGVDLDIAGGDLRAAGWLTAGKHHLSLSQWRLNLPLDLMLAANPGVVASGSISGRLDTLVYASGAVTDLKGQLSYPGGAGHWQQQAGNLPAMQGILSMEGATVLLKVNNSQGLLLARATLDPQALGKVEIYRRLAEDMNLSEGKGSSQDAIFRASQSVSGWLP